MPVTVTQPTLTGDALEFLTTRPPRFGVLATINEDGTPLQAIIWYRVRDEGGVLINSKVGRRWPSNLLRDSRFSFAVEDGQQWVSLRGQAEFLRDGEGAQEDIASIARLYETPEDLDSSIRGFRAMERISFVLRPRAVSVHL
jgi:PPOX class probable F420-dependent enzyme